MRHPSGSTIQKIKLVPAKAQYTEDDIAALLEMDLTKG